VNDFCPALGSHGDALDEGLKGLRSRLMHAPYADLQMIGGADEDTKLPEWQPGQAIFRQVICRGTGV
jgi:hypothetical protein